MTKLAVLRGGIAFQGSLALLLATGCAMDAGPEMALGDEPGMGAEAPGQKGTESADPANPDESDPAHATGADGTEQQGTDQAGGSDGAGAIENMATVMSENFENDDQGAVASPWSVSRSLTSQATIESTSDHGHVFDLQGSPAYGDFLIAQLGFSVPSDVAASVDIDPAPDGSFVWSLHGKGVSTYKRRIRLQRWPNTNTLVASASPSGDTSCGPMPSNTWTRVTLIVHAGTTTTSTFDVLINGRATSCTGLRAYVTQPFNMVQIMDSSSDGWGGDVRFDNIEVAAP